MLIFSCAFAHENGSSLHHSHICSGKSFRCFCLAEICGDHLTLCSVAGRCLRVLGYWHRCVCMLRVDAKSCEEDPVRARAKMGCLFDSWWQLRVAAQVWRFLSDSIMEPCMTFHEIPWVGLWIFCLMPPPYTTPILLQSHPF